MGILLKRRLGIPLSLSLSFFPLPLQDFALLFAVEDLNLNAVESLRAVPFLAIGKHLCGPATGEQYAYEMTSPNLEEDSNKLCKFISFISSGRLYAE